MTLLRSSWGFEEINDEDNEEEDGGEMSEQSQDGSQGDYEARTHTRFEQRHHAKRHPEANGTLKYIGNGNSPHSNQKGGDVPQFEDVGNFQNTTPPNEVDFSHLAEASRRSPMVSTGGNYDSNPTNPDLNSQRLPARNDPRFGSKTFSTIPLGGEAPNFNQSTFLDTTKGDHRESKHAHDIEDENPEEEKKNRIEDHSNMFIKIQYENETRFAEHVEDKHHNQDEEPPHLRLIGTQNDHKRSQLETPYNLDLKKVDSAMSLLSVSQYPHLLEPTFISFANVPIVSNQNAVPDLIGSSTSMLPQGISNRESSPQLHHRHLPSQIHSQSMLQLHNVPQSQTQLPEKVYLKKHTQSQINVTSSGQNQQHHNHNNSSQQYSPHNQSHQHSNSNHQIHSPNLIHSPSQSPQLLTPKTQATSHYGEKNKGIFYLLKEKLNELKKQKKSKSAATATTTGLGLEDLTSEIWTQKNTQNMKSTTHQFSSNPSLPLNNTASKENSQYLQSFLKSYYDVQSGSMTIIGKKKKGNHGSWGQHDDSVESPDNRKRKRITLAEEDDHQRQGAAGYMGGESSELGTDSNRAGEHRHHEQRKLGRMQTNSVQTSQATSSEHKQSIRQRIISKHGQDRSLIQLRLFGFVAILAIVVLTIYSFVNTQNLFSDVKIHINNIPWSNTLRAVFSFPFVYMSLKSILEVDAFGDSTLYSSDFATELAKRSENDFYLMNNLLLDLQQQGTEGRDYFSYVVNEDTYFLFSQDDATVPTSVVLTRDDTYKSHLKMSILQFVYLTVTCNRQAYDEEYKGPFHQKFIIDNFVNFISNMTTVQTKVQDRSQAVLNSISSSVTQLIILVTSVSFVLIFIVFPLYFFVQLRNEQVLKLLATIQPLTLQQMLRQISLGMFVSALDSATTPNDKVVKFKTDNIRKKKNISNTTTISKFKFIHLIIALVAFGIITIQPAVTVILTQQYIDEAQLNINLLGKLYNLIAQSASNMVVVYNYMNYKLVAAGRTYNPGYYLVRSNALVAGNENVLNDVSKIIQSSSGQTKRQQDLYQKFFYKFLNTNMCQALEEYPEYIETGLLDVSTCSGISSGILSQGFQVSMKKYLQSFRDLNQIFNMAEANIIPGIQAWQKLVKIRDFDLFAEFLVRSIIVQKDFLVKVMTDDIEYISTVSIGLLLFQVILLGGFFSYFWHRIYHFISTEMFIIRNILTVLTIDAVVENPYIISYLTK